MRHLGIHLFALIFLSGLIVLAVNPWLFKHSEPGLTKSPESSLFKGFLSHFALNDLDKATAIVIERKFEFRKVFHDLMLDAVRLKFENKADSANALGQITSQIATIYETELNDSFLKREFDYCGGLEGDSLREKVELELLYQAGQKQLGAGNYAAARLCHEQSLKLSRSIGDMKRVVDNNSYLQYLLYYDDSFKQAMLLGDDILTIAEEVGYLYRIGRVHYMNAAIRLSLGNYREAIEHLEAGLEIVGRLADDEIHMQLLGRAVTAYRHLGVFQQALKYFKKGLSISKKRTDKREQLRFYLDGGKVYESMGDYANSLDSYQKAELLAAEVDSSNYSRVLMNKGDLYRTLGNYDKALQANLQALEYCEGYYDSAYARLYIGDTYRSQGELDKALDYYQQAKNGLPTDLAPAQLISEIWLSIGNIHEETGSWLQSNAAYTAALESAVQIEEQILVGHALVRLGNILRKTGKSEEALSYFTKALNMKDILEDPDLASNAYYGFGLTLRDQGEIARAEHALLQAVSTIEITVPRIIGDYRIYYFATAQNIYDELILLQYMKADYQAAFSFSERARARGLFDLFQSGAQNLLESKGGMHTPPSFMEIKDAMDSDIQLLEYKVTENKLIIFLATSDTLIASDVKITRSDLNNLVGQFRKAINVRVEENSISPIFDRDQFLDLAKKLYSITIAPVYEHISPDKILYIAPDDILNNLPFAAFVRAEKDRERFLIEDYAIAYTPSGALLKRSLNNFRHRIQTKEMKFFAVGNPSLDLPNSSYEVREIAEMFKRSETLVGREVDEAKVTDALSHGFDIIHFATHAIIDEVSPLYSYLILGQNANAIQRPVEGLTRSGSNSNRQDNVLMAHEVFNLPLNAANLVNLSACETAAGQLLRGEGIIGLAHAFMLAGAASIITTLWKIDDRYTRTLMIAFYQKWVTSGLTKAEALRQAQLQIMHSASPDFHYPHLWAAFRLVGEYR